MQEETLNKNPLDQIDLVVEATNEESKKTPEETVVAEVQTWTEIKDQTQIPTSAEAQAHIDALNNGDIQEDKSLIEVIYEDEENKKKSEAEKDINELIQENELPEVIISDIEKEKQIEAVVVDIEKIIDKDISPEKVVEQLTEMFIEKEDSYLMDINLKTRKIVKLEEIIESQNETINKLKYSDWKVDVVDDFMGALVTTYKDSKSNPQDVKLLAKLGQIHLLWMQRIRPELDPDDIREMIKNKRDANLKAIQGIWQSSEKNTEVIQSQQTSQRTRPTGLIVG